MKWILRCHFHFVITILPPNLNYTRSVIKAQAIIGERRFYDYYHISYILLLPISKDNSILVCRLAMGLICAFLRMVWGGRKGEEFLPSVRASIQPDTSVGTVRFRTQYLKDFSGSKFLLYPFYYKGALLWLASRACLYWQSDVKSTENTWH